MYSHINKKKLCPVVRVLTVGRKAPGYERDQLSVCHGLLHQCVQALPHLAGTVDNALFYCLLKLISCVFFTRAGLIQIKNRYDTYCDTHKAIRIDDTIQRETFGDIKNLN